MQLVKSRPHPDVAQHMIDEEVAKGHMLGPFTKLPFPNMFFSPINLVPKAGSEGKFHLIHDLSYPYNEESVYSCIPATFFSVHYTRLDDVIDITIEISPTAIACRLDIRAAYHNAPLNFCSIIVLGLSISGKLYVNICLPFGAGSSCTNFRENSDHN